MEATVNFTPSDIEEMQRQYNEHGDIGVFMWDIETDDGKQIKLSITVGEDNPLPF